MPAQAIYVFNLGTSATTVYANNLYNIVDVAFDPAGNLYYSQHSSYGSGTLTRVQGGVSSAIPTPLISPEAMVFDKAGNLFYHRRRLPRHVDDDSGRAIPANGSRGWAWRGWRWTAAGLSIFRPLTATPTAGSRRHSPTSRRSLFPQEEAFFAGGTSVSDASPTVLLHVFRHGVAQFAGLFPTPPARSEPMRGVTCIANRLCWEPFVNSFVHPGPQSDYVVATSNLGTQLTNLVYGIGINSQLAFNPGNVSQRLNSGPVGSFTILESGDIFRCLTGHRRDIRRRDTVSARVQRCDTPGRP